MARSRFRSTIARSARRSPPSDNPARHRSRSASCIPISIPSHEIAAVERLARELPDVSISRSSDVLPQIKEYERVSTTIVNAYVGPLVRNYLTSLEQRLDRGRLQGQPVHHPVAWRHGAGRGSLAACRGHGAVGARRRHFGRPALRRYSRHSRSRAVRHGRHQHRHLADFGRAGVAFRRRHAGRATHRLAQPRHRQHRGRRRLDRQRRCRRHACRSVRKAPARCRDRPATAMAARRRPSPMPMSCSAISTPAPSWADKRPLDRAAAEAAVDRVAASLRPVAASRPPPASIA